MKANKEEENNNNSAGKIPMSLRVDPEFKVTLAEEAWKLGMKLAEYLEVILHNRVNASTGNDTAKKEVEQYQNQITEISALFASGSAKIQADKEKVEKEKEDLIVQVAWLKNLLAFLENPHLLYLFHQVKGKSDSVTLPDGTIYPFVYQQPSDLVLAMIYSYELKK